MWMEVHIYSVKTKSQAGNMWVKDIMTTQKGHSWKKISQRSLKFMYFVRKFSRGAQVQETALLGFRIYENTH